MKVHPAGTCKLPASVLTIGALDGVHRGHQALVQQARERAHALRVPLVVYTFDPPPRVFFQSALTLTTVGEKLERLRLLGVDHAIVASFDREYATRSVRSFMDELKALCPLEIWVGRDFRFGTNRDGDIERLQEMFMVQVMDAVCCSSGEVISSSRIRALLKEDRQLQAEQLLGWPLLKV